jgi:hypothetical protein
MPPPLLASYGRRRLLSGRRELDLFAQQRRLLAFL